MNRRHFIVKSSAASAALLTGTSLFAGSILNAKNNQINVGVIGTGGRGLGLIPILNKIDGLNVYACCEVIPSRLKKAIDRSEGKAKPYTNYKALLDDKNVDAVVIATPFYTHSEIAMASIDAGKHVYCEKTLAKSYQGIKDLVAKVKSSKKIFQTGHQYHSSKLYAHVIDLVNDGKIGKILSLESQWNRVGDWRKWVPKDGTEKGVNWRMYREYSGGLTAELCSHQIDFTNWLLKSTPKQVMGFGGIDYWKDGRETYDNVHLLFNYDSGVRAKFSAITTSNKNSGGYQIKILGDKGTIQLTGYNAWFLPAEKYAKAKQTEVDGVSGATPQVGYRFSGQPINVVDKDPTKTALTDFRDSIYNNTEPKSNLATGANTAVCVQMGLDAMYNNKIVTWDDSNNV